MTLTSSGGFLPIEIASIRILILNQVQFQSKRR
jgi:hypothetical protein